MKKIFDVIICGFGIMGRAAAATHAERGLHVLGLDRYGAVHDFGSSAGQTRMFRSAYFEGDFYIPLLTRSFEAWREWEKKTGETLLDITGGLFIGPSDGKVFRNSLKAAKRRNLSHDVLSISQMKRQFPALHIPENNLAVIEHGAGQIKAERAMECFLAMAREQGADIHFDEPVEAITPHRDGGVSVLTGRAHYSAQHLILAVGPWSEKLLAPLGLTMPLTAERQILHWFSSPFGVQDLPPAVLELENGDIFYCFPEYDLGWQMKCAWHRQQSSNLACDPDQAKRNIAIGEMMEIRDLLVDYIPCLKDNYSHSKTCLYTMTPDEHFMIGAVPGTANIYMAGGFSGHGFKFAPVVGEILADFVAGKTPGFDLAPFSPGRFL